LPKEVKMKDKFKEFFKQNFKNKGSKAKIMLGVVVLIFLLAMTVVTMRKTVTVSIDGSKQTFVTYKDNVKNALENQGIQVFEKDDIEPALDSKVADGQEIQIVRAVPVNVEIAGQEHELYTTEETVGEMLLANKDFIEEQGVSYDENDEVTPPRDTRIGEDMDIQLIQVEIENVTEKESINYETVVNVDDNKDINSADEVTQTGVNGTKDVEYKIYRYEDGTEKKVKQSETIVQAPQDKIVVQGGGYFMASRGGDPIKLQQETITVSATSYYLGTNAITATGRKAVRNFNGISTIAVDPSVIPLGSLVYIEGYGKAVAADTGSAIKGNLVDVYLNSTYECKSWGRKTGLQLGIIAYPGEW
jgi:uncharacterized protein YabE (DUF348 family)